MTPDIRIAIDVVLPVYNGSAFVTRALDSVIAQEPHADLGDWDLRIHVINDASSDESGQVLADYAGRIANPVVQMIITTLLKNAGVAHARNLGIASGEAPYVAFIDQDDEWVTGKLARQIAALEADPSLGYAVGQQQFIVQPGQTRPAWCREEWLTQTVAGFVPSALVVRREVFGTVGVMDSTVIAGGDDSDWFARARTLNVPFWDDPHCMVNRYVHEHNASGDIDTSNQALLDVVRRHVERKLSS